MSAKTTLKLDTAFVADVRLGEHRLSEGEMAGIEPRVAEILREIDLFIVLAVYPGFGGQPFSPITIPKIEQAVKLRERHGAQFDIGVDGCVNIKTVPDIVRAGGTYLIAGSSVFSGNIAENVQTLKKLGEENLEKEIV